MKEELNQMINKKYFEKYGIVPANNSKLFSEISNENISKERHVNAYERLKKSKGNEFVADLEKLTNKGSFTCQAMGDKYGLSRQRIHQLFKEVYPESISKNTNTLKPPIKYYDITKLSCQKCSGSSLIFKGILDNIITLRCANCGVTSSFNVNNVKK